MDLPEYTCEDYQTFVRDMQNSEKEVRHYRGRFFYEGPAVACSKTELQDVIRATKIQLQWDNLGLDLIVYPTTHGK